MKKLTYCIIVLLIIFFESCNNTTTKIPVVQIPLPHAVPADSIIFKFKNTPTRKVKLKQGVSSYIDTTYKMDLFIVTDTVSDIRVDNKGKGYIILGRVKNGENIKCYFSENNILDSLKLKQVITVSSNKHVAKFVRLIEDTTIKVFVVEMANCTLIY